MTLHEVDRFTELLCSRLCHDLISPIGAINNGLELVAEGDIGVLNDAMSLIGSSSRQASNRLAYFRLAFGAWGTDAATGFGALRKTIDQYFADKCPIDWIEPVADEHTAIDKAFGKLLLNLLLVAAECAQREARINVEIILDGPRPRLSVAVRGERCRLRDDVRSGFTQEPAISALTVRNVIAHHCRRLSGLLALDLTVADRGPNSIEFTAA